ncbi:MAG: ABC transporter ATP-binding protein [Chromatiaceae bacterium]|nr:ABC transporter ATP-binding protein [Chromatiaceae bacterium]
MISVERLSKRYRLGVIGGATLREDLNHWWARVRGRHDLLGPIGVPDHGNRQGGEIWALRDVSFEVQEGEILGVIGRNGAGKSTLLKILSRITAPTSGRAVIRGRVGSLLEVGTGFHPELTGRENIYLNGTILGMTKAEVDRKLEEIVEFAEMAPFIDTPVKRYSSGMTVRLAFAVAAHLEPEILIVDEVLAVGDASFQKKCLGKMEAVAAHGRTVLFVSHNMQSVQSLCTRCVLLNRGQPEVEGAVESVVDAYLRGAESTEKPIWADPVGLGDNEVRLHRVHVLADGSDGKASVFFSNKPIRIDLEVSIQRPNPAFCIGFDLMTSRGETVFRTFNTDVPPHQYTPLSKGRTILSCVVPTGLLNAGRYFVAPRVALHGRSWILTADPLISFSVSLAHGQSAFWNLLNEANWPGVIAPILEWKAVPLGNDSR